MRISFISFACVLIICFASCNQQPAEPENAIARNNLVADTITYDVLIINPNPEDTWTTECLDNLDRKAFIDQVFAAIYSGNLKPVDYYEDKPIKLRKLKKLESNNELDRTNIGKVQFTERWYYDPLKLTMKKEVISMVFGEHIFNDTGEIRGYKPVFKVYLK